jgi:hypothetical protein
MERGMSIDTLGYVKRLEAAGFQRQQAEAQAEALRDEMIPQLATRLDLDRLADRMETLIWKHTVAIILALFAVGGFLLRFNS